MTQHRPAAPAPAHDALPPPLEVAEIRRRTEAVFDRTLSAMFDAMGDLSRAEAALLSLAGSFSPPGLVRLRELRDTFQGLATDVEAKAARSRSAVDRLERLMRGGSGRLDDLRRLTRTAALVALNAQVVSGTIRADGRALDDLARTMREVLAQVASLVADLALGIVQGAHELRRVSQGAADLQSFADREAIPAIQRFASLIETRARDKALARSAGLVSGRLAALQDRIRVVVTHFQVGDGLRQRLEHVETILARAEDPRDPVPAPVLGRLAALQLRAALSDLNHALHEGRRCLRGLGRSAGAVPDAVAINELEGHGPRGLAPLMEGARRIETTIEGLTQAGQGLAEASAGLAATLGGVGRATRRAAEFEKRMTVLGLNAILLSSRLGSEGRAMVEVAQQLRDIARSITEVIALLRQDTEGIADTAGGLDVPEDEALARRLIAADEAADEMSLLAGSVRSQLAEMGALRSGSEIAETFRTAERELAAFQDGAAALAVLADRLDSLSGPLPPLPAGAEEAVAAIRRIYTMKAERDVHDGLFPQWAPLAAEGPPQEDVDDIVLFA